MAGTHLTQYRKQFGTLPHNSKKSVIGTIAFIVSSLLASFFFLHYFSHIVEIAHGSWIAVLITVLVGALVESLPGQNDWDNITVFIAAVVTLHTLGL